MAAALARLLLLLLLACGPARGFVLRPPAGAPRMRASRTRASAAKAGKPPPPEEESVHIRVHTVETLESMVAWARSVDASVNQGTAAPLRTPETHRAARRQAAPAAQDPTEVSAALSEAARALAQEGGGGSLRLKQAETEALRAALAGVQALLDRDSAVRGAPTASDQAYGSRGVRDKLHLFAYGLMRQRQAASGTCGFGVDCDTGESAQPPPAPAAYSLLELIEEAAEGPKSTPLTGVNPAASTHWDGEGSG